MTKFWRPLLFALVFFFFTGCRTAQNTTIVYALKTGKSNFPKTDTLLSNLLSRYPQYFDSLLRQNDQWYIQIIYTQINRNKENKPLLSHYYFNVNPAQYFYPASTVKMPVAALALQKLNELKQQGLNKTTTMTTDAAPGRVAVYNDPSSKDGRPTVANYVKKIFLVSDNEAYNRLYEFVGQEYANDKLHKMGYDSVQLLHRLQVNLTEEQNRTTNAVTFFDTAGKVIYQKTQLYSGLQYQQRQLSMGKGYMSNGKLVNAPFDFSQKSRFTLTDLHSVLQSIVFPETVPKSQRFNLTEDDYRFLYKYMSMMPRESRFPQYDSTYTDAYVKFFLFGGEGAIRDTSIRIFNKVGDAYGFLTDVAYVVNFSKGIEFMLSATIYCNSDGIFNDDKYDYNNVGFPFFKHLGEVIYNYEYNRPKKHMPDLSRFTVDYGD